eukprot:Sspe_Gene.55293::Locus_30420_Transcript_1_1_Confidence_1.000_Length_543::g.55293::m.55293
MQNVTTDTIGSGRTPRTPRDGKLTPAELQEYLTFLKKYTMQAQDSRRWLEEQVDQARKENRKLETWRARGDRPKAAYLLSLINENNYDMEDPRDARFVDEVRKQRQLDRQIRRYENDDQAMSERGSVASSRRRRDSHQWGV